MAKLLAQAFQAGLAAARPSDWGADEEGGMYASLDTLVLERWNGAAWEVVATAFATAADVPVVPTGDVVADDVQEGLENATSLAVAAQADIASHILESSGAHAATAISFAPSGGIAATNVGAALGELDSEKAASSHTHVPGDVTGFDTQVRTSRLDQMAAPTADVSLNSHKLTNVTDPSSAQDAATKAYVDAATLGIAWKQSVRVATTVAGTLATSFENGDTVDGVVLATGDRILIKNQAAASENGIYTVNASGAPTRATDADSAADILQASVYVREGTANADTLWTLTTNAPITLGSTNLTFAQLSTGTSVTEGAGIDVTGGVVSLDINSLTADASPDSAADYGLTWDTSASSHKKVLLSNWPGGSGGTPSSVPGIYLTVTKTSDQGSIPSGGGTDTKVTFGSSAGRNSSLWASDKFTPGKAGEFLIQGQIYIYRSSGNPAVGSVATAFLYKNGVKVSQETRAYFDSPTTVGGCALPIRFVAQSDNASDYFEVYVWQNSGSGATVQGAAINTYFTIAELPKISAAVLPAGARKLISETVSGADANSLTVDLPTSGYKNVIIEIEALTDESGGQIRTRFDGNTGSVYDVAYVYTGANGSSSLAAAAAAQTYLDNMYIDPAGVTSGKRGLATMEIYDYRSTSRFKNILTRSRRYDQGNTRPQAVTGGASYLSNSAISQVSFYLSSGNIKAGAIVRVYGITDSDQVSTTSQAARTVDEVVLAADQTNVRFPASGNLPTGYAAWELHIHGRMTDASSASEPYIQFNGDTGSNYDYTNEARGSTSPGAIGLYAQTAFRFGSIPSASNAQANVAGGVKATIFDPEGSFWKSIHAVESLRSLDSAGLYRYEQTGEWKSTAAITSMLITGNFKAGTRFTLVGIPKAASPRTS